ncbi:hypothetical protein H4R33_000653 [Dimargaris cristalligena]|nr:hypothetical protein H4R33_000653 [Dimargaris cristalligena]
MGNNSDPLTRSWRQLFIALEEASSELITPVRIEAAVTQLTESLILALDGFQPPSASGTTQFQNQIKAKLGEFAPQEPTVTPFVLQLSPILDLDPTQTVTLLLSYAQEVADLADRSTVSTSSETTLSSATTASSAAHLEACCTLAHIPDLVRYYYAERTFKLKTLQSLLRIGQDNDHCYYATARKFFDAWLNKFPQPQAKVFYQYVATRNYTRPAKLPAKLGPIWALQLWEEQENLLEVFFLLLVARPICSPPQTREFLGELVQAGTVPVALRAHVPGPAENAAQQRVFVLVNIVVVQVLQLPIPRSGIDKIQDQVPGARTLLQSPEVFMDIEQCLRRQPALPFLSVAWGLTWARLIQLLQLVGHSDKYQTVREALWLEDEPGSNSDPHSTTAPAGRDNDRRMQWIAAGFQNGMLELLEAALLSDCLAPAHPNAPGYRQVLKEMLMQVFCQIEINHLPDFERMVECTALLFHQQPELCVQFWTEDIHVPGRGSLLEYARGRFPYAFRPFTHLITALFTPESAEYVSQYMQQLPTLTHAVLPSDQSSLALTVGSMDIIHREALRPIPIFPGSRSVLIPAGTVGSQMSASGQLTIVRWPHPYVAWDFFHHLLDYLLRGEADDETVETLFGASRYAIAEDTLRLYQKVFAHFFSSPSEPVDPNGSSVWGSFHQESPSHAQDILIHQLTGLLCQATDALPGARASSTYTSTQLTAASKGSPLAAADTEGSLLSIIRLCLECLMQLSPSYLPSVVEALDRYGVLPSSMAQAELAATPDALSRSMATPLTNSAWVGTIVQVEARRQTYETTLTFMRLVTLLVYQHWPSTPDSGPDAHRAAVSRPVHPWGAVVVEDRPTDPSESLSCAIWAIHHHVYRQLQALEFRDPCEWAEFTGYLLELYRGLFKFHLGCSLVHPYAAAEQGLLADLVQTPTLATWEPIRATLARAVPTLHHLRFTAQLETLAALEGLVRVLLAFLKILVLTMYRPDLPGASGLLIQWRDLNRAADPRDVLRALYPCLLYTECPAVPEAALAVLNLLLPLARRNQLELTIPDTVVDSDLYAAEIHRLLASEPVEADLALKETLVQYLWVQQQTSPTHAFLLLTDLPTYSSGATQWGARALVPLLVGWLKRQAALRDSVPSLLLHVLALIQRALNPSTGIPVIQRLLQADTEFWKAVLDLALFRPTQPDSASDADIVAAEQNGPQEVYYHQVLAQKYALALVTYMMHAGPLPTAGSEGESITDGPLTPVQKTIFDRLATGPAVLSETQELTRGTPTDPALAQNLAQLPGELYEHFQMDLSRYLSPIRQRLPALFWYSSLGAQHGYNVALVADSLGKVHADPADIEKVAALLQRANHQRSRCLVEQEREVAWGTLLVSPRLWQQLRRSSGTSASCTSCQITALLVDRLLHLGPLTNDEMVVKACNLSKIIMTVCALCRLQAEHRPESCDSPVPLLQKLAPLLNDHLSAAPEPIDTPYFSPALLVHRAYLAGIYACLLTRQGCQTLSEEDQDIVAKQVSLLQPSTCEWLKRICSVYEDVLAGSEMNGAMSIPTTTGPVVGLDDSAGAHGVESSFGSTPSGVVDFVLTTSCLLFHELFRSQNHAPTISSVVILQQHHMFAFFAYQLTRPRTTGVVQNLIVTLWSLTNTRHAVEQLVSQQILPALEKCPLWSTMTPLDRPGESIPRVVHTLVLLVLSILTNVVRTLGQHSMVQMQVLAVLESLSPYLDRVMVQLQQVETIRGPPQPWDIHQLATIESLVKLANAVAAHGQQWSRTLLPTIVTPILLRYVYWFCRPSQLRMADPWNTGEVGLTAPAAEPTEENSVQPATQTPAATPLMSNLAPTIYCDPSRTPVSLVTLCLTGSGDPAAAVVLEPYMSASATSPLHTPGPAQLQTCLVGHVLDVIRGTLFALFGFTPTLPDVANLLAGRDPNIGLEDTFGHQLPWLELSMSVSNTHLTLGTLLDLVSEILATLENTTGSNSNAPPNPALSTVGVANLFGKLKSNASTGGPGASASSDSKSGQSLPALMTDVLQHELLYILAQVTLQAKLPSSVRSALANGNYHHAAPSHFRDNILPSISREISHSIRRLEKALEPQVQVLPKATDNSSAGVQARSRAESSLAGLAKLCQLYPDLLQTIIRS